MMFCLFTWFFVWDVSLLARAIADKKDGLQLVYGFAASLALVCTIVYGSATVYRHIQTVDAEIRKVEVE